VDEYRRIGGLDVPAGETIALFRAWLNGGRQRAWSTREIERLARAARRFGGSPPAIKRLRVTASEDETSAAAAAALDESGPPTEQGSCSRLRCALELGWKPGGGSRRTQSSLPGGFCSAHWPDV